MKKTKLLSLMFLLSFLGLSTLIFLNANATTMKTTVQTSPLGNVVQQASPPYNVTQVDHTVKILQGGSVTINDTVQLSANQTTTLTEYSLGFPYGYKYHLANVFAFNTSNSSQTFNVTLDTGLGSNVGYYGVTVIFPQGGVHLYNGKPPFRFTVVFVFSDIISSSTTTGPSESNPSTNTTTSVSTMYFPMFPSLIQKVSLINVTVITPPNTAYEASSFPGSPSIKGSIDTGQIVNFTRKSLEEPTNAPGWLNFTSSATSPYQVITMDDLERYAEIDGQGNIFVTDTYVVTSHARQAVNGILLSLPTGASNVTAYNAQGNTIASTLADKNTTTYSISFGFSLQQGNSTQFKLTYFLPSGYLSKTGISDFDLNLPITKDLDGVVGKLTFKISLPEGASIKEYPSIKEYDLQKEALQEEILFTAYNVSSYSNLNMHMKYVYSVFWASFHPTLWMTAIAAVAVAIALSWRRPKPSLPLPMQGVAVKPTALKSIVSSYEERTRILRELESIERQTQKGKLPRRRYKIRRRMLENQLSRLDRELVDLKQRVKSVGPKYTEILKELDIAEAELEGVEAEVKRVEVRYRSSAISLDAYRRLQDQLNKRREKAKTTIDGALLRLSEGIA